MPRAAQRLSHGVRRTPITFAPIDGTTISATMRGSHIGARSGARPTENAFARNSARGMRPIPAFAAPIAIHSERMSRRCDGDSICAKK